MSLSRLFRVALLVPLVVGALAVPDDAQAQEIDGPTDSTQQGIVAGTNVDIETQRRLGLVTVNGGCSGTLLNRYWVLTARHCVTGDGNISTAFAYAPSVLVTATWAPDRVGIPSRFHEFAVNVGATPPLRDIVLVYLGSADLGRVNAQEIYLQAVYWGDTLVGWDGLLTTDDTVTQYGQGLSTFAQGVFGTPSAVAAGGSGIYRSGVFTPSTITDTHYRLAMNGGQVGHGGDSGGPTVVTVGSSQVGIAGVQSTCARATPPFIPGYMQATPPNPTQDWLWTRAITHCTYVATAPLVWEIYNVIRESPRQYSTLYQRHVDGRIWKYTGSGRCEWWGCPGWIEIDANPATLNLATARGALFQRHRDGRIFKYDGSGQCYQTTFGKVRTVCPGWTEIDRNPATAEIVGGNNGLYQRHFDNRIWKYDGIGRCEWWGCPGWIEIDRNPATQEIVPALGTLFQRHIDGRIWKYNGSGSCDASGCPGWTEIDRNPATAAIAGGSDGFYQRHFDGSIWKYDGNGRCEAGGCPGWTLLDANPATVGIVASGGSLFQRHVDNSVWRYDGIGYCEWTWVWGCSRWTQIDRFWATAEIASGGGHWALFQRHHDGRIWQYDGIGRCDWRGCPGWIEIDRNPRTAAIIAVEPF